MTVVHGCIYLGAFILLNLRGRPSVQSTLTAYRSSNDMPAQAHAALVDIAQAEGRAGRRRVIMLHEWRKGERREIL